LIKSRNM